MGWLSKIFNYVPAKEREGILFGKEPLWLVSCCKDFPSFLRALKELFPLNTILYIESSGKPPNDIQSYIEARKPSQVTKVAMGTIWPRPQYFHLTITAENLEGLAQLAEKHYMMEIAVHLHVYYEGKMLLQWYDAFTAPFYISLNISEDKVKQFCNKLGLQFKKETL